MVRVDGQIAGVFVIGRRFPREIEFIEEGTIEMMDGFPTWILTV